MMRLNGKTLPLMCLALLFICFALLQAAQASSCKSGLCGLLGRENRIRQQNLTKKGYKTPVLRQPTVKGYPSSPRKAPSAEEKSQEASSTGYHEMSAAMRKALKKARKPHKIASTPIEVHPEKTVWITLSNTDVNRIVCLYGKISDVFTSSEKGVVVTVSGDEAYIKFKVQVDPSTGKVKHITTPTEFFIRCGGETYSFEAKPRSIPARTVYLVSTLHERKPDADLLEKSSVDEAVVTIVRKVFTGKIPPSWEQVERFTPVQVLKNIGGNHFLIKETNRWRIPGVGVLVRLFEISPKRCNTKLTVNEKLLLDPSVTRNPIAISILDHILFPFSQTEGVVVERAYRED